MTTGSRQNMWKSDVVFLDCIQSQVVGTYNANGSNSSWIQLPYTVISGDVIEVKWRYISIPSGGHGYGIIFGGGDNKYGNWRTLAVGVQNNATSIYNSLGGSSHLGQFSSIGSVSTVVVSTGQATQDQDPAYPMTLFIQNENSQNKTGEFHGYTHQMTARCWYCRIYRSNDLIFDLQPAKIGKNIGMLNKVDNHFYTSKCDVQFIAGPILTSSKNEGSALILFTQDEACWKEAA